MATRNRTHRKKKISNDPSYKKKKPLGYFPIQRKMECHISTGAFVNANAFGDAGAMLSRQNNRLYRYGKMYDLKFDASAALTPGIVVEVYALANTWYVQKAFEEAKAVYDQAYENEMDNINETNVGRWRDFRCRNLDVASYSVGRAEVYPATANITGLTVPITGGQFVDSLVEDQTGTSRTFTWSNAPTASSYGIMQQYDLAGNQTRTPATGTGTMPYADLEADSSAAEGAALQTDGQDPPYVATAFPDWFVKVGELTVGTAGQTKLSTGYFPAPCGLFFLRSSTGDILDVGDNITLEVRAGKYKGVHAENMERI